ncbi:DUF882 domain-containing protein [Desulforhabdus sp. TSK]|uniref:YcbK family protein n=1 Tax=Desulforhabdus sp. TSK TaxID=2925014 RepID=UPI001FC848FC|nr:DUF882 domain-containing protein [Desulforhabdus sp. TSK]
MTRREMLRALLVGTASVMTLTAEDIEASLRPDRFDGTSQDPIQAFLEQSVRGKSGKDLLTGELSMVNANSNESIRAQYLDGNRQLAANGCRQLSYFFRCQYTGQAISIHPELFLLLDAVRHSLGVAHRPFVLFSGYRSPSYNRRLARRDGHVARNSYHIRGMAADVALEGVSLRTLATTAKAFGVGGVSRYGNFVHMDVGPVRTW